MNGRRRAAERLWFWLPFLLVSAAVFRAFFHWQILIPTNVHWLLQGDWGAHVLGWNALRHDRWRWPLGATRLLAWPTGAAITYTDSNPLLCLLLKPVSAALPSPFQFTGLWLLGCLMLQFATAYALLRHATAARPLRAIGATLFVLTPTLMNRIGHADLVAHWTILLALNTFLNVESSARRDLWYGAILLISGLIHPYFLPMNASIWGADVLRRACPLLRAGALRDFAALAARTAAVAAAPVLALWAVGGLGGYQGEAGGFGYYSMSLDALINPGRPGYSLFLAPEPQGDGQIFEGFQYLGLGLLMLLGVAATSALVAPEGRAQLRRMGWALWLAPALLLLTALALSDQVQFHGHTLAHLSYAWAPFHVTSLFRGSGRLFWPCTYVLILAALELVFALPRRAAYAVGLAAIAIQALDLSGFAHDVRELTADAVSPRWSRAPSRAWDALIASAAVVEVQPPNPHLDEKAFYEIAWRAASLQRPVNTMYTARVAPRQQAFEDAAQRRFLAGQLDPSHLYVLIDGCAPPRVQASRIKLLDGIMVIPPAGARYPFALPPAPDATGFPLGRTVALAPETPQFRCMLGRNWSLPEGWGVWSDGPAPELTFNLVRAPARDLLLTLDAQPFPDPQGVSVLVAGRRVGRLVLTGGAQARQVRIPHGLVPGPLLDVTLQVDHPQSPRSHGLSPDSRLLGIGLRSVRLDAASP